MAVTLAEVTKLYVATFNRAPDAAGINYWTNSGMSIENIAQSFFDQSETQTLYPSGIENSSFVTSVYDNLFNRAPDTDGLNYWVGELNNGNISKQNFILAVINGAQNTEISQDGTILTNKQTVGLDFVAKNLESVDFAQSVMANIDASTNSVNAACAEIAKVVAPVGDLTEEMISGLTLYNYDIDLYDSNFANGLDALHKMVFNANGTVVEERYTAPFGSSSWTLGESDTSMTWSIVNGKLVVVGSDSEYTWSDNLTLLSQTATGMTFYHQGVEINTMGTSTTTDDVTENFSEYIAFMFTVPTARTEAQLLEEGLFKETFSGQVNFVNSAGTGVAVPTDAKVALTADHHYDGGRICLDINDDGSFSGTGYLTVDFSSASNIEYQIFHDTNNDGNWSQGEDSYFGFGQVIDVTGISTPVTVMI